jgi:hypothetical protein
METKISFKKQIHAKPWTTDSELSHNGNQITDLRQINLILNQWALITLSNSTKLKSINPIA